MKSSRWPEFVKQTPVAEPPSRTQVCKFLFLFLTHTPKSKSGRPKNPGPATAAHRPFAPLNLCRRVIRPSRPLDRRRLHPIPAAPLLTAQSRCVYAEPPRPRPLPAGARNTPSAVRIDHNTPFHRHLVPLSWTGLPLSRTPPLPRSPSPSVFSLLTVFTSLMAWARPPLQCLIRT